VVEKRYEPLLERAKCLFMARLRLLLGFYKIIFASNQYVGILQNITVFTAKITNFLLR